MHGARDFMQHFIRPSLTHHSYSADERYEEERQERKAAKRRERQSDRRENDEYIDDSEDEWAPKTPKMLEAPASTAGASSVAGLSGIGSGDTDFVRDDRNRRRERDSERERVDAQYNMSGGPGRRE